MKLGTCHSVFTAGKLTVMISCPQERVGKAKLNDPLSFPSELCWKNKLLPFLLAVPSVTPREFSLKPDSSGTGLIATWTVPDPTRVNGKISFYIIKYRKQGEINEQTTNRIEVSSHLGTAVRNHQLLEQYSLTVHVHRP